MIHKPNKGSFLLQAAHVCCGGERRAALRPPQLHTHTYELRPPKIDHMGMVPAFWQREARIQRILIVAIFFVSSLQFFIVNEPAVQSAIHASLDGAMPQPSPINANSTAIATINAKNNIEFCGHCAWDAKTTCNERLKYTMKKHHNSEEEARKILMPDCGVDYDTEPYVLLHAGPHKTGKI